MTEKECFEELERNCRLIAYCGMDDKDLIFCRKQITSTLEKLAEIRGKKKLRQDERRQYNAAQKGRRVHNCNRR